MIQRITKATLSEPSVAELTFNDGTSKTVDVASLLDGPVFDPLKDPAYFVLGQLDPVCGTVVWPNGADFAPEALFELDAIDESLQSANKTN
ncbi:MAG: DUF2442 domain-containing protein [Planctomycetaceae bacterium]